MLNSRHLAIAAAAAVAFGAPPVFGQSFATRGAGVPDSLDARMSDLPGERAAAVIRSIEKDDTTMDAATATATAGAPVTIADLAAIRAGGEARSAERSAPALVERLQLDDGARTPEKAQAGGALLRNSTSVQGQAKPQIVRIDGQEKDRAKTQAATRLDDRARYREQAKYDADRKRRDAAAEIARGKIGAADSDASRIATAQGRADPAGEESEGALN